jgi:hypothetical protein
MGLLWVLPGRELVAGALDRLQAGFGDDRKLELAVDLDGATRHIGNLTYAGVLALAHVTFGGELLLEMERVGLANMTDAELGDA